MVASLLDGSPGAVAIAGIAGDRNPNHDNRSQVEASVG